MRKLYLRLAVLLALLCIATAAHGQISGILSTNPPLAVAGSGAFTLNITGFGFSVDATAAWNGSNRTTTWVSSTMLTVAILQSDVAAQGAAALTVTTSGGGTSAPYTFQINGPLATVYSWSPTYFTAGQSAAVNVSGYFFVPGSTIYFDNFALSTTFVSGSQLSGSIPGTDVIYSGAHKITVRYPNYPSNGPAATIAPGTLAYGSVVVGNTSSPQTVTLTNVGNATLNITSIATSGASDFVISANTCGSTLATGISCTVSVTLTPSATVGRYGQLIFTDSAGTSPQAVGLNGMGYVLAPVASFAFTNHNYGSVTAGVTSGAITETVTNTGTANLTFSVTPAISGPNAADFAISAATCSTGSPVTPGSSCTTSITFTPSTGTAESATLTYTDNASGSPHAISLSGTGVPLAPVVAFSKLTLAFGLATVGSTTADLTETVTNNGNANLVFSVGAAITGPNAADFAIDVDGCGTSTVTPTSNCTTTVNFTPSGPASETATLTYRNNAANSPQTISLTGTGVANSPGASLSTSSIAFGNIVATNSSAATAVTLTNTGGATLTISSIALGGTNPSDFSKTTTCGGTLAAFASCTVSVTFTPAAVASYSATLTFTDNATPSTQVVTLTGTGTTSGSPTVSLSGTLAFGSVHQGMTSAAMTETVSNTGTANLVFTTTPVITGTNASDFVISGGTCSTATPVSASSSCNTTVTFSPSTTSSESATLTYTDNASGSPHTVSLTGTGTAPATHSVTLNWTASVSSNVIGYLVSRGTANGGPYGTLLTPTPINAVTYNDATVANGITYYYVVVTVGMNPPYVVVDSVNSSQTTAVIP